MRPRQESLAKLLRARLHDAKRVGILACGSELRGDDIGGIMVAESLERWRKRGGGAGNNAIEWETFIGYTAPENMTGEIKRFDPTHLLIVDAADIGSEPGDVRLIDPWDTEGPTFGTHKMPPNVLVEYLRQTVNCDIAIVAMQHGGLEFGEPPSSRMRAAVRRVIAAIRGIVER